MSEGKVVASEEMVRVTAVSPPPNFLYNLHMAELLLQTKLFAPPKRSSLVSRPHLIAKLNQGLQQGSKLTLISAPAGFGKTTLVREWLDVAERPFAWLSLDEKDADQTRFWTYFLAALQTISADIGAKLLPFLQSPQVLIEPFLTALVNEIVLLPMPFVLVLDDYHVLDSQPVDEMLAFLLTNLPPQMHLVITTREDPNLPLARWRARRQLSELRANDLRFTLQETAVFLQQIMNLNLSEAQIATLEARTEGWIAGLQLAALSMQGQTDTDQFIHAFRGSHRFVLDYLVEEVLQLQPENVQKFLLHTSILDRLCGSLCDALMGSADGQQALEYLEHANLFLIPLDNERHWYRYHHLFAELLRQRLAQLGQNEINSLHIRASEWFETNGLELEAFHHATAAHDVERAVRLIEGEGLPLYFRGEVVSVQHWLDSLPEAEFKVRPSLWVTYASVLTLTGRLHDTIEEILQAAETALPSTAHDVQTNDLLGQIAAIRAMLGVPKNQVETIITQSRRALDLLHPDNTPMRTTTTWTLGYAYQVQGNRAAASQAYAETIVHSQKSSNIMTEIAATTCLGQIQETENKTHQAAESFQRILQIVGDPPWPAACEAFVGLARIHYQWNDLAAAERYGQQGFVLARQLENVDTPAACGILLARVKLAQGDVAGALATLAEADRFVQQYHFDHWLESITAVRIQLLLHQNNLTAAAQLAQTHQFPISQARVYLAQGKPDAALTALEPVHQQAQAQSWVDKQLEVAVLQALAYQDQGDITQAVQALSEALSLATPGGFVRIFVDEGVAMAALLREVGKQGLFPTYVQQLLAAFDGGEGQTAVSQPLPDPLSERELEVLKLLATDMSGPEIARHLMVSLNTMRTHTKSIYSKLGVGSRRTAVRRAEELQLV